ncbi:IS3 family transposase [Brevibacillus thermoruber]|jgi:putative transposase|uniref:IS3 family transposase n=1 Tax=Brevibacillus TaxID=55080 RepID=UPI0012678E8E
MEKSTKYTAVCQSNRHSSLKYETFYLEDIAIVEQIVQDYIHYYNPIRIQMKLNNQSPIQYRQLAA